MSDMWIEWSGGECPVDSGIQIDVVYRSGGKSHCIDCESVRWSHKGAMGDIIAYRLHRECPEDDQKGFDAVENPEHYCLMPGIEVRHIRRAIMDNMPPNIPYDQVDDWSRAWEYVTRMWGKNGLEDAKKGYKYLGWLIEKMESEI